MHVNKVSHVTTISQVAKELGENEDCLFDVAAEMEPEDGLIWVCGITDDGVTALTDFGTDNLVELMRPMPDGYRSARRHPKIGQGARFSIYAYPCHTRAVDCFQGSSPVHESLTDQLTKRSSLNAVERAIQKEYSVSTILIECRSASGARDGSYSPIYSLAKI